jgi:hypothetical protein
MTLNCKKLNGLYFGHVLHSRKSCADIAHHIGNEMRRAVVKNIVLKQNKMSAMIDESMTINGKTVLVVCLRTTVGESTDPQMFYFDLEHVKGGDNAKAIYDALLNCLQKSGFSVEYLKENLISFVSDGTSIMLGQKLCVAKLFPDDFPNTTVWYYACHRLEFV